MLSYSNGSEERLPFVLRSMFQPTVLLTALFQPHCDGAVILSEQLWSKGSTSQTAVAEHVVN